MAMTCVVQTTAGRFQDTELVVGLLTKVDGVLTKTTRLTVETVAECPVGYGDAGSAVAVHISTGTISSVTPAIGQNVAL